MVAGRELRPVTEVNLSHTQVTDAELAHLAVLPQLQALKLCWCYDISDAGLANLKKLTQLQTLNLATAILAMNTTMTIIAMTMESKCAGSLEMSHGRESSPSDSFGLPFQPFFAFFIQTDNRSNHSLLPVISV